MDSSAIKYVEDHYTSFSGLQFSRALKLQTLQQAKQVFNAANLSIANQSLKVKKAKELILWARRVRKQDIDSKFYSIKRQSLFHSKKLIEIQDEDKFANKQLNEETITETEEVFIGQSHEKANTEKEEMFIKENHKENDDDACDNDTDELSETRDTEETKNLLIIPSTGDFKMKFERSFDRMKTKEKWYLSNGSCVEDEIFAFGMQCKVERPCHSFIADPADSNYQKYGVFSDEELMEIRSFKEKKLPTMPTALRDYLNQYNLTTTAALRQKIFSAEPLDPEYSQDMDWIKLFVYSFVREHESENLKRALASTIIRLVVLKT